MDEEAKNLLRQLVNEVQQINERLEERENTATEATTKVLKDNGEQTEPARKVMNMMKEGTVGVTTQAVVEETGLSRRSATSLMRNIADHYPNVNIRQNRGRLPMRVWSESWNEDPDEYRRQQEEGEERQKATRGFHGA